MIRTRFKSIPETGEIKKIYFFREPFNGKTKVRVVDLKKITRTEAVTVYNQIRDSTQEFQHKEICIDALRSILYPSPETEYSTRMELYRRIMNGSQSSALYTILEAFSFSELQYCLDFCTIEEGRTVYGQAVLTFTDNRTGEVFTVPREEVETSHAYLEKKLVFDLGTGVTYYGERPVISIRISDEIVVIGARVLYLGDRKTFLTVEKYDDLKRRGIFWESVTRKFYTCWTESETGAHNTRASKEEIENDEAVICEHCDALENSDDSSEVTTARGLQIWCQSCRDDDACSCDSCGDATSNDLIFSVHDSVYCESCGEDYSPCSDCGDMEHIDELMSNRRGELYCSDCYQESNTLKKYSARVQDYVRPLPNPDNSWTLGVEVETILEHDEEIEEFLIDNGIGICKEDASISGFELVTTYGPWKAIRDKIKKADWILKGNLVRPGEEVGIHVHIGRSYFNDDELKKIYFFFNYTKNNKFVTSVAERPGCHYAQYKPLRLENIETRPTASHCFHAVNLRTHKETVEIRLFNSGEVGTAIKAIEFVAAVVDFTRWQEVKASALHFEKFLAWMDAFRTDFPTLARFLVEKGWLEAERSTI